MLRKYYFLIEILLGFAVMYVVEIVSTKSPDAFFGVVPHPYWVVVLLMASRYGALEGVVAGGAAALTYLVLGTRAETIDLSRATFPYGAYNLPFFFVLAGGLVGQIRSIYKRRHFKLDEDFSEAKDDLQELSALHSTVLKSKEHLERRIAFQSNTMMNMIEHLNTMETLDPEKVFQSIPDLLIKQLNAQCASVYVVRSNALVLLARVGEGNGKLDETIPLTEGLMGRVVQTQKVVSISQVYPEDDMAQQDILISAPIMAGDLSVSGIMNVEKMEFYDLTLNTERLFDMLSRWLSVVIERAVRLQDLKDRNIEDEITGAYNYLYFQKRLTYEFGRAKRYKYPLSLLMLRIPGFDNMPDVDQEKTLVKMNKLFEKTLRHADIISKYQQNETYAILLPHTPLGGAERAVSRLKEQLAESKQEPSEEGHWSFALEFGLSGLWTMDKHESAMLDRAEEGLRSGDLPSPASLLNLTTQAFADIDFMLDMPREETPDLAYILGHPAKSTAALAD